MKPVLFPDGFRVERLMRSHRRRQFISGQSLVDDWLKTKALQHQEKHLSATTVLLDSAEAVAGYFTLATGEVDFSDLPAELTKKLPKRSLPVVVLAWLGVSRDHQKQGLGQRLVSLALRECHAADQSFGIVAVILDCIDESAKEFYRKLDFAELPGHPMRLYLSAMRLHEMMHN